MIKKKIALAAGLMCLLGCSNPPYQGHHLATAEEFVIDSYKIRKGKLSIMEMEGLTTSELSKDLLEEKKEIVREGDVLGIVLYHPYRQDLTSFVTHISQQGGFKIVQGAIQLPDLGFVELEHLTLGEAREKIEQLYQPQAPGLEVFLSYKSKTAQKVQLLGLVSSSSILIDEKTRLFDVLAMAKIAPEANLFKSYVVRDEKMLPVDLSRLIHKADMSQNIVMKDGDKIYIAEPSASTVMMLGELGQKGLIQLPCGSLSLREAIAKAGGIPFTGDKAYIQVIRGSITKPKIYTLHWKQILELPSESILLMPGDIVYVAATPITEWNRFVSQLFPSFTALDWMSKGGVGVML